MNNQDTSRRLLVTAPVHTPDQLRAKILELDTRRDEARRVELDAARRVGVLERQAAVYRAQLEHLGEYVG